MQAKHALNPWSDCSPCRTGFHDPEVDHPSPVVMVIEDLNQIVVTEDAARGRCPDCYKFWDSHPGWVVDPDTRSNPQYKPACFIAMASKDEYVG